MQIYIKKYDYCLGQQTEQVFNDVPKPLIYSFHVVLTS